MELIQICLVTCNVGILMQTFYLSCGIRVAKKCLFSNAKLEEANCHLGGGSSEYFVYVGLLGKSMKNAYTIVPHLSLIHPWELFLCSAYSVRIYFFHSHHENQWQIVVIFCQQKRQFSPAPPPTKLHTNSPPCHFSEYLIPRGSISETSVKWEGGKGGKFCAIVRSALC